MCDGDCCKTDKTEKKENTIMDTVMSQPPMVWAALALGFVVATMIRK